MFASVIGVGVAWGWLLMKNNRLIRESIRHRKTKQRVKVMPSNPAVEAWVSSQMVFVLDVYLKTRLNVQLAQQLSNEL